MAFFVVETKGKSKGDSKISTNMEIDLLAVGKRVGLSFMEMNELRVKDLLDLAKSYSGVEDDNSKEATQADIDKFFT